MAQVKPASSLGNLREISKVPLKGDGGASSQHQLNSASSLTKKSDGNVNRATVPALSQAFSISESTLSKRVPREYVLTGVLKFRFLKKQEANVYCAKFSVDDDYFAVALGDGSIDVYHIVSGSKERTLLRSDTTQRLPCTSIAFRPNDPSGIKSKNVLIAAYADGTLIQWHFTSGKTLWKIVESVDNQINSVSYNKDGSKFVTAGSDCGVRVYDDLTRKCVELRDGTENVTVGHSNRVFTAKFHPTDANVVISAGWDDTIQFWDLKQGKSVRSIYGPHICGDALDFNKTGETIAAGSYTKEHALQLITAVTGDAKPVDWSLSPDGNKCLLYSCGYSASNKYLIAGGGVLQLGGASGASAVPNFGVAKPEDDSSSSGEAKLFENAQDRCVGIALIPSVVTSVAVSKSDKTALVAGGKNVYFLDIDDSGDKEFLY